MSEGWVSLHLDARRPGVVVPESFATEPHLVLQYGRNMPVAIPDLDITDEGVDATLSFSRVPCHTHIPWSAVYAVACTDGRGVLYDEDIPQEVTLVARSVGPPESVRSASDEPQPASRPILRAIPADEVPVEPTSDSDDSPKRRRKPQLRLVK